MRFKTQRSTMPEVNLVPMMDVLMSVLTFFIITSMTLTGRRLGNINLPGVSAEGEQQTEIEVQDPLIIGLNQDQEILLENRTLTTAEMLAEMRTYLGENPEGKVILKADQELEYEQVVALMREMSKVGGGSVALAVQKN